MPKQVGATQKQAKYSLVDCVPWYISQKTKANKDADSLRAAQVRKTNLESDRIALELAEKRLQLIEVSKIADIWGKVLGEFKTNILNIPKQISALFDTFEGSHDLEASLSRTLSGTLDRLSRVENLIEQALESDE